MKSTLIDQRGGLRTFVLVLATGDEAVRTLTSFAVTERLGASHFTAIGAFSRAVVAYFDWSAKQYRKIAIDEQVEVLSLIGDISLEDGTPKVHAHAVLGKPDATEEGDISSRRTCGRRSRLSRPSCRGICIDGSIGSRAWR